MVTEQAARGAEMPVQPASGGMSHVAFFYRGQRDYVARIEAFASAGLANGEAVLIAVPGDKGSLLRDHLGDGTRRLHYADMTQLGRNPARIIPEVRDFLDAHSGQRVRYVGEPIWPGRSAAEMREATRHEALINLAFPGTAATILCPYDAAALPRSVIHEAGRTHPAVLADGHPAVAGSYAGPGNLPPGCDRPLPAPAATAEILHYETDLRPIRHLVAGHASRAGLGVDRVADLVLAVSELAANTLRHSGGGGTLQVWHTGEEILCQIQDQGWITDPLAGRVRRPPDQRGHGLWVVNQVCDLTEMRTGRGGTTIRLHMTLRPSGAGALT